MRKWTPLSTDATDARSATPLQGKQNDTRRNAPAPPEPAAIEDKPKFGTGKGKIKIIDPHVFDPMTDEEVDAWIEGRY
jgi:hypothetical protein